MCTCVHYTCMYNFHETGSKAKPVYLTDATPISSLLVGTPCVYHYCAFNNMVLQHMQIYVVNTISYLT